MTDSRTRRLALFAAESVGIALVYFLLARVGQILAIEPGNVTPIEPDNVTPIWPASGFALAIVLYRGYRTWAGLWLGNFLGNTWAFLDTSSLFDAFRTIATGIAIGPGDVLQAFLGAYLISCFCEYENLFGRIRNVFLFVGSQAIACLSSATFGVLSLCVGDVIEWDLYAYTWLTWFLGDGIGVILVAPLLLTINQSALLFRDARLAAEGMLILTLTAVSSYLVFGGVINQRLIFVPIVFILWAAVRANQFAVSLTVLAVWSVAFWSSLGEEGPFLLERTNDALMLLQLYAAIAMVTGSVVRSAISELNSKKDELRASEERFRTAVEASPSGILVLDQYGLQQLVNSEILRLFDRNREELIGKSIELLFDVDGSKQLNEIRQAAFTDRNAVVTTEMKACRKDGREFDVEVSMRFLATELGPRLLCSVVDITSRQETIRALRAAMASAEEASAAKSGFLASISHEIRTPMNAVLGMSELMLHTELTANQRDYLATIAESAESLMAIIDEVLDFSKIESGKIQIESIPFSLRKLVANTLKSVSSRSHAKGLELIGRVNREVPDRLVGDPVRLRQVLTNLVGNALKFTEQGEVELEVIASSRTDHEIALQVTVRDTGIGIPVEHQQLIFEAFTQADMSTTRQFGGTGLGLSIVKTLVELMGGQVNVHSEVGVGSTFTFTVRLPIAPEARLGEQEITEPTIDLRDQNILVVDDNERSLEVLREMLQDNGATVFTANKASEALNILRQQSPDQTFSWMITDMEMPDMTGIELVQAMRDMSEIADTRVILLTSLHSVGDSKTFDSLGLQAHLTKPVSQFELASAIANALQNRPALSPKGHPVASEEPPTRKRQLEVLLAEDGVTNQRLAVAMLEKLGHKVVVVDNGADAIKKIEASSSFDLVLMDLSMPVMDGLEATKEIRRLEQGTNRHVPIVAVTAHAMSGDRDRCLAAGMDYYLSKPIRINDLVSLLDSLF